MQQHDIYLSHADAVVSVRRGSPSEATIRAQRHPDEAFDDALARVIGDALVRLDDIPEAHRAVFISVLRAKIA